MLNDYKFSVLMSVYHKDNPVFFDTALDSVIFKQTLKPNEVVLVVDGPVGDEINNVITKYKDYLSVIRLDKNGGLGNALRIGLDNAKFELVARMDSDDVSSPTRFEEQIKQFRENQNLDVVGGDISEFINLESNIVGYRKVPLKDEEIKKYLKSRCPLNHVSVMYKKTSVIKSGGYLDLFWNEDYYLWIRMVQNGSIMQNTGTVLVNVRVGEDMYNRRGGIKYFKSEKFLQKYMLSYKMIGHFTYFINVIKRFIVQLLLPNKIRGWVFRTFARSKNDD